MKTKKTFLIVFIAVSLLLLSQLACSCASFFNHGEQNSPANQQATPQPPAGDPPAPFESGNFEAANPNNPDQHPNTPPENQGTQNNSQAACTNQFEVISSSLQVGQNFSPGEVFEARWKVRNTGSCEWTTAYNLVLFAGDQLGASNPTPLSANVPSGHTVELVLQMTAPTTEDSYVSLWKLEAENGQIFEMVSPPNNPLKVAVSVTQTTTGSGSGFSNLTPMPLGTPIVTGPGSSQPQVTAMPANTLFIESEADQVTLGVDECYDLVNGVEVSCSSGNASFKYDVGSDKILWGKNGLGWGVSDTAELTKTACMGSTNFPDYMYLTETMLKSYRCFKWVVSNDTYYGWVRVTYFNPNQVTFDYLTYTS